MSVGMGMRVRAAILSLLGPIPSWEVTCPRKSTRAAPIRLLLGDSRRRAKKSAKVAA